MALDWLVPDPLALVRMYFEKHNVKSERTSNTDPGLRIALSFNRGVSLLRLLEAVFEQLRLLKPEQRALIFEIEVLAERADPQTPIGMGVDLAAKYAAHAAQWVENFLDFSPIAVAWFEQVHRIYRAGQGATQKHTVAEDFGAVARGAGIAGNQGGFRYPAIAIVAIELCGYAAD